MKEDLKQLYKTLNNQECNNFEIVEITKLITPAGLCKYYDNINLNKSNCYENKLFLHKYDIKLFMSVITLYDDLVFALPVYIYPIAHKDKYGFEYFDKLEACNYYTREALFRLKKYNNGIKILNLNNKDFENIKIKLYEINNLISKIDEFDFKDNDKLLSLIFKIDN